MKVAAENRCPRPELPNSSEESRFEVDNSDTRDVLAEEGLEAMCVDIGRLGASETPADNPNDRKGRLEGP